MRITRSSFAHGSVSSRLDRIPTHWSYLFLTLSLGAIYFLDRWTVSAPVQHLYYIPLVLSALRLGRKVSLVACLCAILLYHLANPRLQTFGHNEADIVQICIFIGVSLVTSKLASDSRRLRELAATDDLTGLRNLRGFEAHLERLIEDASKTRGTLAMMVLDLDRLKRLNDTYGHLAGADAVRATGRIIAEWIPASATACRYGGDEFAIALPASIEQASELAGQLRDAVRATAPVLAGRPMPAGTITISIGVAFHAFTPGAANAETAMLDGEALFRAADEALYRAKDNGRDQAAVSALSQTTSTS